MPKIIANGLKAMAFVMPKNILTQMSLKKFDNDNKTDLVSFFATINEAQQWIDKRVK